MAVSVSRAICQKLEPRRAGHHQVPVAAVRHFLSHVWSQLLERTAGPFHFRFVLQPIVATVLAIRAGRHDARTHQPPYLACLFSDASQRRRLLLSGWTDVGRVAVIGVGMDALYQLIRFRWLYLRQALFVAFLLAVVPYCLMRGPVNRVASRRAPRRNLQDCSPKIKNPLGGNGIPMDKA